MAALAPERTLQLPMRSCVGIALFNRRGKVWIGQRCPRWMGEFADPIWQMPQGGIARGERPSEAALRELAEETGITSVEIVDEIDGWLTYELPQRLIGIALKGRYRGQRMRWFAMRFTGKDSEIDIRPRPRKKAEFEDWRWAALAELPSLAVPFKRRIYRQVADEFAYLAR